MGVTFGGQPCLDPVEVAEHCREHGLDTSWVGMPNSFRMSAGPNTGIGWALLSLAALQAIDASTKWLPPFPPPYNLAGYGGVRQITINWNAGRDADTFNIYRSTKPGGEGGEPIDQDVEINTYTDSGLEDGTIYFYQVSATNSAGRESLKSQETMVATAPPLIRKVSSRIRKAR